MQVLQVQLEVRPDPAEVGRARRWARSRLARSGIGIDETIAETLILIVSELVTNAVVHTGCPAVLRILLRGTPDQGCVVPALAVGTVRVEVADSSTRAPRPRLAEGDETGGRGLALVDGLADRWGWERCGAGKRIWCELDRSAAPAAPPAVSTQVRTAHPGSDEPGTCPQAERRPALPHCLEDAPTALTGVGKGASRAYQDMAAYEAV